MIGPLEQLHIENDFYFKVKRIPKKLGCTLYTPECRVTSLIRSNERAYIYKDGILSIKDKYKDKTAKLSIPRQALRPAIFLDILLQVGIYECSPNLIVLYDENDNAVISQDVYEFLNVTLTIEEANEEKVLFDELPFIMDHDFKNNESLGYKMLQNCSINGGLV